MQLLATSIFFDQILIYTYLVVYTDLEVHCDIILNLLRHITQICTHLSYDITPFV